MSNYYFDLGFHELFSLVFYFPHYFPITLFNLSYCNEMIIMDTPLPLFLIANKFCFF